MMIEDQELKDLFKAESEEHLQNLDEGLLLLEKDPHDQQTLEEVFREAHSLKGASRMLGIVKIESISHTLEDILGDAKRGAIVLSPELIDRMYYGLDAIKKLVDEALTGNQVHVDTEHVINVMTGKDEPRKKEAPPERAPTPIETEADEIETIETPAIETPAIEEEAEEATAPLPEPPTEVKSYKIETIRVKPQKLDVLMTHSGELTVTKIRIARRLGQIEEILAVWEEWSKDSFANRFAIDKLAKNEHSGELKHVLDYLGKENARIERLGVMLNRLRNAAYEDTTRLEFIVNEMEEGIRAIRLLPLSTIFNLFARMVRDLAKGQSKDVSLKVVGGETTADKQILEEMKDPLMHMIRNAVDHGIELPHIREQKGKPRAGTVQLKAYHTATSIVIEVTDDGRGLDIEKIKQTAIKRRICRKAELDVMTKSQIQNLIFTSGFSTSELITDVSGRGVGMDVVRNNIENLKGTIEVKSQVDQGCTIQIKLPITLATTRVLIASIRDLSYAIPVEFVETTLQIEREKIFSIEGRETITMDGRPVSVARLTDLLELPGSNGKGDQTNTKILPCIILSIGEDRLGLIVDSLLDEQEVVLKPHSGVLQRVRNVSGATILGTGEICMVLNPPDLMKSVQKKSIAIVAEQHDDQVQRKQTILLVEDSITTRTQEKRILESAGYDVVTAVDGVDGFNKLSSRSFDAVISDIEMPNMTGLALTEKIRQHKEYDELPVILVTSLASEADKKRGVEVGANAYITKGTFDQKVLIDTLQRLI